MTADDHGDELRRALDENRQLRAEIDRLRADNGQLRGRLNDLEAKLEAALRADYEVELDKLEQQLRALLTRPVSGADNPQGRLLRHLGREFDALFTFLRLPGCRPPIGWPSKRFAQRWSTARCGAATEPGTAPAIRNA